MIRELLPWSLDFIKIKGTVTAQRRVCDFDLSIIEKKEEEKSKKDIT